MKFTLTNPADSADNNIMETYSDFSVDFDNFGSEIKCSRLALGLTQSEAAKLLEISERTLWDWEAGKVKPAAITQEGAIIRLDEAWNRLLDKHQNDEDFAFFESIGKVVKLFSS